MDVIWAAPSSTTSWTPATSLRPTARYVRWSSRPTHAGVTVLVGEAPLQVHGTAAAGQPLDEVGGGRLPARRPSAGSHADNTWLFTADRGAPLDGPLQQPSRPSAIGIRVAALPLGHEQPGAWPAGSAPGNPTTARRSPARPPAPTGTGEPPRRAQTSEPSPPGCRPTPAGPRRRRRPRARERPAEPRPWFGERGIQCADVNGRSVPRRAAFSRGGPVIHSPQ